MKLQVLIMLFSLSLSAQKLSIKTPIRFLALGDSYTIGQSVNVNERWPVQLLDSLAKRSMSSDTLQIIATTGWRTDNLISAITGQSLAKKNFNLVALLIGVNNQYQGKPLSQYKQEFPQLLDSAIRYAGGDKTHVFIVSIPDYAYTPYGQSTSNPSQISNELDVYNQLNKHYADSAGIKYFNITPISRQGVAIPSYVAGDGLHPSGKQYGEWVRLMLQYIDSEIVTDVKKVKKNADGFFLRPNPAIDRIVVTTAGLTSPEYEIIDLLGATVKHAALDDNEIDIKSLPQGVYFLKVYDGEKCYTRKFMKN
jgi:lysophospholipase L1-like esterase